MCVCVCVGGGNIFRECVCVCGRVGMYARVRVYVCEKRERVWVYVCV